MQFLETLQTVSMYVLVFILGSVMGSFLECLADRRVKGVSIITKGRSYCPSCNHTLGVFDLIPIWSWLFLGGKCRYCKSKIPARHVIVEAVTAVAYVSISALYGFSFDTIRYIFLISILIPASLHDLDTQEVPNGYFITGAVFWLVTKLLEMFLVFIPEGRMGDFFPGVLIEAAIGGIAIPAGMLLVSIVLSKVLKKDAIGGADIKLLFTIGLYLGAWKSGFNLFLVCIVGLVFVIIWKKKSKEEFALVPAISIATFISIMLGDLIVNAYLSLFI